jgi:cell division protein FtsL
MWTWLLNPKNILIVILGVVVVGLVATYYVQRGLISAKNGKIAEQEQQITALTRSNEILNNNAVAAKEAEKRMKEIATKAVNLRSLVESIPEEVRKGLKNETMEKINSCYGDYFTSGVWRKDCNAVGAVLPQALPPAVEGRE